MESLSSSCLLYSTAADSPSPQAACSYTDWAERSSIALPDHREHCAAVQLRLHCLLCTSLLIFMMLAGLRKPGQHWRVEG